MIDTLFDLLTGALLLLGGAFALIGSIGLVRLPDLFTRLHGPTKATTLGVGAILLGSMLYFSTRSGLSLHEVLVSLFLFITAPVSAHLIARAAIQRRCDSIAPPPGRQEVDSVDEIRSKERLDDRDVSRSDIRSLNPNAQPSATTLKEKP